ncbi:alpha-1,2-fucosyltransferase, partial [Helicobacter pylori]
PPPPPPPPKIIKLIKKRGRIPPQAFFDFSR